MTSNPLFLFPTAEINAEFNIQSRGTRKFQGQIPDLAENLKSQGSSQFVFQTHGMADRFSEILRDYEIVIDSKNLVHGNLSSGFEIPNLKISYQTESDIFGQTTQIENQRSKVKNRKSKTNLGAFISDFRDLKSGDFVVHVDHGIGRFESLQTIETNGVEREFMLLIYADKTKLFVPVERMDLVSRYSSGEATAPTLDKLGGMGWQKTKAKAKPHSPADNPRPQPARLEVVHPHAAGIDIHSDIHWVCVGPQQALSFGANTADLQALADYLRAAGVTSVAMESTSVYWEPLYALLESQGFEVFLVNPGQLHSCGARPKTDKLDCQWLQRLHTYGLLKNSFRPSEEIRRLRTFVRLRQQLIRETVRLIQHLQKALDLMNVKLTVVLSDITGVTGLLIIKAILAGCRDPYELARLRHDQCARTTEEIAQALHGLWQPEYLYELKVNFELFETYQAQLAACDQQIEAVLKQLPDRSGTKEVPHKPRQRGRKKNDLHFAALPPLFKAVGVDLTAIEGIDVGTALLILAEIGVEVRQFPDEKHFASWLGLCPNKKQSNQTQKRGPKKVGNQRLRQALRLCARAAGRTKTPLGAFYRRLKGRLGGRGAMQATAHKLARLVYRLLRYGKEYVQQGLDQYEAAQQARLKRLVEKKAAELGYDLVLKATPATA